MPASSGGKSMWCPVCKTEYQEGITVCNVCGSKLEEGTGDSFTTVNLYETEDKETALKLLEYLQFSEIVNTGLEEEDGIYIVNVPQSQEKEARKLISGFIMALQEEQDKIKDVNGNSRQDNVNSTQNGILNNASKTYIRKADEYKDVKTSGITFIIFGLIGILYLILCRLEVIPLTYNEIVLILLLCMFMSFVVYGFSSIIKSKKIKGQIAEEETLTSKIKLWLGKNITDGLVKSWKDESVTEEENELIIISKINEELQLNYPEIDKSYLEMVADEYFNEKFSARL